MYTYVKIIIHICTFWESPLIEGLPGVANEDLERFASRHSPNLKDWMLAYNEPRAAECRDAM